MVPKRIFDDLFKEISFRAVLFRMVPKQKSVSDIFIMCFRAVLFRMVPKRDFGNVEKGDWFRAVLFRMVPKPSQERIM